MRLAEESFEFGKEYAELMILLHGGLVGENTERFIQEVAAAHGKERESGQEKRHVLTERKAK